MILKDVLDLLLASIPLVVLAVIASALARVWKLQRLEIAFHQPRCQAVIAALVAALPFVFLVGLIFLTGQQSGSSSSSGKAQMDNQGRLLSQLSLYLFFYLLPMFVVMRLQRQNWTSIVWSRHNLGRAGLIGLLLGAAFVIFIFLSERPAISAPVQQHLYSLLTYTIVGFAEETLFRGFLQTRIVAWLGAVRGLAVASVLFALDHLPAMLFIARKTPEDIVMNLFGLGVFGLFTGYLLLRTGNTVAPAIYHTLHNFAQALT